jgi:hypothetical protein
VDDQLAGLRAVKWADGGNRLIVDDPADSQPINRDVASKWYREQVLCGKPTGNRGYPCTLKRGHEGACETSVVAMGSARVSASAPSLENLWREAMRAHNPDSAMVEAMQRHGYLAPPRWAAEARLEQAWTQWRRVCAEKIVGLALKNSLTELASAAEALRDLAP